MAIEVEFQEVDSRRFNVFQDGEMIGYLASTIAANLMTGRSAWRPSPELKERFPELKDEYPLSIQAREDIERMASKSD